MTTASSSTAPVRATTPEPRTEGAGTAASSSAGSSASHPPRRSPAARRMLVRRIGSVAVIAGLVLAVSGVGTALLIREQLRAESITLHEDAPMFAGTTVDGPIDAFLQAEVIRGHAEGIADGRTYAELDRDDPARGTLMETAFLRASLFTSVIAFGIAALVTGLGVLFVLVGAALRTLAHPEHGADGADDHRPLGVPTSRPAAEA